MKEQSEQVIFFNAISSFSNTKYYQNKPRFHGPYSRSNLPNYNLPEYNTVGTHSTAFYVNGDNGTYFDDFGVEHIPKEIEKFVKNKNIKTNIYRMQANDSIICESNNVNGLVNGLA